MYTYARPQVDQLIHLLTRDAKPLIVAVTGPRQTGKTTIIHNALGASVTIPSRYVAVDEIAGRSRTANGTEIGGSEGRAWLLDQVWNRGAERDAKQSDRGFVMALDEIQHVDQWSLIAKTQWDRDRRSRLPAAGHRRGVGTMVDANRTATRVSPAASCPFDVGHWAYPEMAATFGFTPRPIPFLRGVSGGGGRDQ